VTAPAAWAPSAGLKIPGAPTVTVGVLGLSSPHEIAKRPTTQAIRTLLGLLIS
jgi:hypothetical protein